MDDLVEKMLDIWNSRQHIDANDDRAAMASSLRVALEDERVLGEPQDKDGIELQFLYDLGIGMESGKALRKFLANRHNRLLAPKTPEERVSICEENKEHCECSHKSAMLHVCLDGATKFRFHNLEDAAIYRFGLIAKLREEAERG